MLNLFLPGLLSFAITLVAIPAIIRVAAEKKLFDVPDSRKLHTRPISSLGGVGIFIGFLLVSLIFISSQGLADFKYFFVSSIIIFFLGLKDDILILSASKKFIGQLVAVAIIIHFGHIRIESMHGLLGFNKLPELVSIGLTYITMIVIINAFNLIDGVDGLAASLGIISALIFGCYFFMVHLQDYAVLAFTLAGCLASFLLFNFNPAKIFMGDSGSLLVGLINSILVLKFISVADSRGVAVPIASCVAIGVAILIVPLLDTLRVFSVRIVKGRSPFSPDRNHIHHLLLARGLNARQVTFACAGLNVSFIGLAWFGQGLGSNYLLLTMAVLAYSFIGVLLYYRHPLRKKSATTEFRNIAEPHSRPVHTVTRKKEIPLLETASENKGL